MVLPEIDIRAAVYQRNELQLQIVQNLPDYAAVVVALVDYPHLAAESAHVLQHVHGPGFPYREVEIQRAEVLHHLDKRLDREGIMLRGHPEPPARAAALAVFLPQKLILLIHLPDVHQEICALRGDRNATAAAYKYLYSDLFFKLSDRTGKGRLRNKKPLRRTVHGAFLGNSQYIFHLL